MQEITINAPAKINIGLNIIGKRPDGYHNIETIFYPINLCDVITFTPSDRLIFSTNSAQLASEQDNLILKAVRLLEEFTSTEILLDIYLEKNIPVGAGLGGGSSDAAAALKAINEMYEFKINEADLLKLALQIGSDVPFFIKNKPCLATSRGEVLTEIPLPILYPILLVNPKIHISTKWAYENIKPASPEYDLSKCVNERVDVNAYKNCIFNQFEIVVFSKYSEIKNIKEEMYKQGALFSLMTGSGSTVFGIYPDHTTASRSAEHFNASGYFTYIT